MIRARISMHLFSSIFLCQLRYVKKAFVLIVFINWVAAIPFIFVLFLLSLNQTQLNGLDHMRESGM